MENQIAQIVQQVIHLWRPQGYVPGQSEINSKGQMNAVTLRSKKELEGPKTSMREEMREVEKEDCVGKEVAVEPPSEELEDAKLKEVQAKISAPSMIASILFYIPRG